MWKSIGALAKIGVQAPKQSQWSEARAYYSVKCAGGVRRKAREWMLFCLLHMNQTPGLCKASHNPPHQTAHSWPSMYQDHSARFLPVKPKHREWGKKLQTQVTSHLAEALRMHGCSAGKHFGSQFRQQLSTARKYVRNRNNSQQSPFFTPFTTLERRRSKIKRFI